MEVFILNGISRLGGISSFFTILLVGSFVFGMKMMWTFTINIPTKDELSGLVKKLEDVGKDLSSSINDLRKEIKDNKAETYRDISELRAETSVALQEIRFIKGTMNR